MEEGAVYKARTAIRLKPHFPSKKAHRRRTKSQGFPLTYAFNLPEIKISQAARGPDFPGIYYPHSQFDHLSG